MNIFVCDQASKMEALITLAMVAGRLLADEKEHTGVS